MEMEKMEKQRRQERVSSDSRGDRERGAYWPKAADQESRWRWWSKVHTWCSWGRAGDKGAATLWPPEAESRDKSQGREIRGEGRRGNYLGEIGQVSESGQSWPKCRTEQGGKGKNQGVKGRRRGTNLRLAESGRGWPKVAERREMAEGGKGKSISEFGVICSECPRVAESVREGSRVKLGSEFFINYFRIFDAGDDQIHDRFRPYWASSDGCMDGRRSSSQLSHPPLGVTSVRTNI
jgi:hypothetical protein